MNSYRQYIADRTELEIYTGSLTSFDSDQLVRAEGDIDKVIASFYEGVNRPFLLGRPSVYSAVLTSTQATVTDLSPINDGYWSRTVLEILDGSNAGLKIFISNNSSNILTFNSEQAGLSETSNVKLYQEAKIPRNQDTLAKGTDYFKSIPEFIKQAVALQYQYRITEGQNLMNKQKVKSYGIDKASYSEDYDTGRNKTMYDRVSPEALDILSDHGLIGQTL